MMLWPGRSTSPEPRADTATILYMIYVWSPALIGSIAAALFRFVYAAYAGNSDTTKLTEVITACAVLVGETLSGALVLILAHVFVRKRRGEPYRTIIGWSAGPFSHLVAGGVIGAGVVAALFTFAPFLPDPSEPRSSFARMADQPGLLRIAWTVSVVLWAPLIEEFLFRGVLFTALRGPTTGTLSTLATISLVTFAFVWQHEEASAANYLALLGITTLGLITGALRAALGCTGPAVAAHFTYNGLIALWIWLA
jgi:membrane protease YdiL (CAAX protease family)